MDVKVKGILPGKAYPRFPVYFTIVTIHCCIINSFPHNITLMSEYRIIIGCAIFHTTCWGSDKDATNEWSNWQSSR